MTVWEIAVPDIPETVYLCPSKEDARALYGEGIKAGRILLAEDVTAMRKAGVTTEDALKLIDAKLTLDAPRILTTPSSAEK